MSEAEVDRRSLEMLDEFTFRIPPRAPMRVPALIYADAALIDAMDEKVREQLCNVAALPGIVGAACAMPDAHWGYGFPIGGVAAFDATAGGVVSAGGVGFDISCGVRLLVSRVPSDEVMRVQRALADSLFRAIPAGVGSTGSIRLDSEAIDAMLLGGATWAVAQGFGAANDLDCIEERGTMVGAKPEAVSERAKRRQREEIGTLGSGNHYLEVQNVAEILDPETARGFGLVQGDTVISIHCGSRGLGHQIGTEFLREMAIEAPNHGIMLPDRELACAPIDSALGQRYLGAMRAAINCALANRQILTHLVRRVWAQYFSASTLSLLYDVSHNTCKLERHRVEGREREIYVHRKGATRAIGPGHPELPAELRRFGQPVFVGGSMGTGSFVMVGTGGSTPAAFDSSCHGAGRSMSRHAAARRWKGRQVQDELAARGILVRSPTSWGIAEEAPGAYKDVVAVALAAEHAGLSRRVARLKPLVCIKG
jgi:tRNA-splicing ligase RtcB